MANELGKILNIDTSTLEKRIKSAKEGLVSIGTEADKSRIKLEKLAKTDMSTLIGQLTKINNSIGVSSGATVNDINKISEAYKRATKAKESLLTAEQKSRTSQGIRSGQLSIPQIQEALKVIDSRLKGINGDINRSVQDRLVELREYYKEEMRLMSLGSIKKKEISDKESAMAQKRALAEAKRIEKESLAAEKAEKARIKKEEKEIASIIKKEEIAEKARIKKEEKELKSLIKLEEAEKKRAEKLAEKRAETARLNALGTNEGISKAMSMSENTIAERTAKIKELKLQMQHLSAADAKYASVMKKISDAIEKASGARTSLLTDDQKNKTSQGSKIDQLSIPQLQEALGIIDSKLKGINGDISLSTQERLVSLRDYYKEEMKLMSMSQEKRTAFLKKQIEAENKAAKARASLLTSEQMDRTSRGVRSEQLSIPQLKEAIGVIESKLKGIDGDIDRNTQERLVSLRDYYKEEMKLMSTSQEKRETFHKKQMDAEKRLRERGTSEGVNKAMGMKEDTIANRIAKIKELKVQMQHLSTADAKYTSRMRSMREAVERLNTANKQAMSSTISLNKSQSKLINTSDQLARKFALMFSVSAISMFITKLVRIRGEFELQQKSLGALLQNKYEADKIYGQLIDLAVRSPFQFKDLVGYTKQLAAYRIETEKLYDTTKKLADVSAGLGVDMNRIILAYGQVKAASVLRGQELRQMTEAGIPAVQMLSDKYTQLEGRLVSVGEVFERVSNRMVSFKDVEDMFTEMTAKGGIFYNMQEIQAETLAGKLSNLKDAYEIMLNKMGEDKQGVLVGSVDMLKKLMENYEMLELVLGEVVLAIIAFKANSIIMNSAMASMSKEAYASATVIERLKIGIKGLSSSLAMPAIGIAIGVLTIFGKRAYDAATRVYRLNKELNELTSKKSTEIAQLSNKFKTLADTINTSADGSKKQVDAHKEMLRTYRDYLPSQSLEIDNLKKMKDGYNSVSLAISQKVAIQEKELAAQKIRESYRKVVDDAKEELKKTLQFSGYALEDTSDIIASIERKITDGVINSTTTLLEYQNEILASAKELGISSSRQFSHITGLTSRYKNELISQNNAIETQNDLIDRRVSGQATYYKGLKDITKELKKQQEGVVGTDYEANKKRAEIMVDGLRKYASSISGGLSIEDVLFGKSKEASKLRTENVTLVNTIRDIFNQVNKITGDASIQNSRNVLESLTSNMDNFTNYIRQEGEGFTEWSKKIVEGYNSATEVTNQYNKAVEKGNEDAIIARGYSDDFVKKNKERVSVLKQLAEIYNIDLGGEKKAKEDKTELNNLKDKLSLLKKIRDAYEKMIQEGYDARQAQEKTMSIYGTSYAGLENAIPAKVLFNADTNAIQDAIREMFKNLKTDDAKKYAQDQVEKWDLEANLKIASTSMQSTQREIEDLFSGFELGLEFDGIGASVVKELLGVDTKSYDELKSSLESVLERLRKDIGATSGSISSLRGKKKSGTLTEDEATELKALEDFNNERIKLEDDVTKKLSEINKRQMSDKLKEYSSLIDKYMDVALKYDDAEKRLDDLRKQRMEATSEFDRNLLDLKMTDLQKYIQGLGEEAIQSTAFWRKLFGDIGDYGWKELSKLNDIATNIINTAKEVRDKDGKVSGYQATFTDSKGVEETVNMTIGLYQKLMKQNIQVTDKMTEKNPFKTLSKGLDAIGSGNPVALIGAIIESAQEAMKSVVDMSESFHGLFQAIGIGGEQMDIIWSGINNTLNAISEIDFSNPISVISGVVKVFSSIIEAIGASKTAKLDAKIEASEKAVRNLQWAYEDLGRAIDDAIGEDKFKGTVSQLDNLKQRQQELYYQADLESQKKKRKKDKDKIDDLRREAELINAEMKDLVDAARDEILTSTAGDISKTLGDALLNAFKSGEDGAKAWGNTVDDIVRNIASNMIMSKIFEKPITAIIDKYSKNWVSESGNFAGAESIISTLPGLMDELNGMYGTLNSDLLSLLDSYPDIKKLFFGGGESLEGLKKGIQGITEPTAQAIEAYLNTIRNEVFTHTEGIKDMATNIEKMLSVASLSLTELSNIRSLISQMRDWQGSITTYSGNTQGGASLKVVL